MLEVDGVEVGDGETEIKGAEADVEDDFEDCGVVPVPLCFHWYLIKVNNAHFNGVLIVVMGLPRPSPALQSQQ